MIGLPVRQCVWATTPCRDRQVKSIAEMGAYVSLLEYNNIEGMILLSELSRRRIRSINKLIRVGRQEIVVVLRVDKDKGSTRARACTRTRALPCALSTRHALYARFVAHDL